MRRAIGRSRLGAIAPATVWHGGRFAALVVATLLLAHDAIYVVRFGVGDAYASAMAASGHGYWGAFTVWGGASGCALLVGALVALARLRGRCEPERVEARTADATPAYVVELSRLWPRLLVAVVVGFLAQEAAEHAVLYGHLPTLDETASILGPASLAVLAAVTFLVAAAGAAVRWRIAVLSARLRASRRPRARFRSTTVRSGSWPVAAALRRHAFLLVRLDAGRAPPPRASRT